MDRLIAKSLITTAIAEAVTGLMLLFAPDVVAGLLLGLDLAETAQSVARIAGIALFALAVACWPGPASLGMMIYGILVTLFLAWLGVTQPTTGPLLWPAVFVHAFFAALLALHVKLGHKRRIA